MNKSNTSKSPRQKLGKQGWHRGQWAEIFAAIALILRGYKILARRYAHPLGEIDIIAVRGKILAIIEVKARPDSESAMLAINRQQQMRITRVAQIFLSKNRQFAQHNIRFDLIVIRPWRWPHHIADFWRSDRGF